MPSVLYRNKYILEGLETIPSDMERDLDIAYNICLELKEGHPCEMCGKCCNQDFITVRDEEIESVAECARMNPYLFACEYLYRDEDEGKWLFIKTDPCAFLNNKKECRIWKGRPEICREFPYLVSKFMSRVYLAIVNDNYRIDLDYMDDTWPCTKVIKSHVPAMIEIAKEKRRNSLKL